MQSDASQQRKVYEPPHINRQSLKTIVLAGATGGGDSGQTGFGPSSTGERREKDGYGYGDDDDDF